MANIEQDGEEVKRSLSWTCVIYPESLPENWRGIIDDLHVSWACSPLHDKDIDENAEGGPKPKKAHYHLLLSWKTVKSYKQVREITDKLKAPSPQRCNDTRGLVRYFLHLDHPSKAQYPRELITFGGGFDLENALKATATEEEDILDEMCDFIREHCVTEFFDFNDYVRTERKEWRTTLRKNCFYLTQIIKSLRHKTQPAKDKN